MLSICMVGKNSGSCSSLSSREGLKFVADQAFSRLLLQAGKL